MKKKKQNEILNLKWKQLIQPFFCRIAMPKSEKFSVYISIFIPFDLAWLQHMTHAAQILQH